MLYETWSKDPLNVEKRAYTKIGLAMLHFLDKKKRSTLAAQSRKRTRDGDSPSGGEDRPDTCGRGPRPRERRIQERGCPIGSACPHEVGVCYLPWRHLPAQGEPCRPPRQPPPRLVGAVVARLNNIESGPLPLRFELTAGVG
jgi:hypothetical protein